MSSNNTSESVNSNETSPMETSEKECGIPSQITRPYDFFANVYVSSEVKKICNSVCGSNNSELCIHRKQIDSCLQNSTKFYHLNDKQCLNNSEHVNTMSVKVESTLSSEKSEHCCEGLEHSNGSTDCKANVSSDCNVREILNEIACIKSSVNSDEHLNTSELHLIQETVRHCCENLEHLNGNRDSADVSSDCNSNVKASIATYEDYNSQEFKRSRRSSKRRRDVEDFCPVCGVTVRYSELGSHFAKEVENLSKIHKNIRKTRVEDNNGVNTTYVQVKSNRENRHAAKVARFSKVPEREVECPVCNLKLVCTQEEMNNHVLNCINEDSDYSGDVNVVDNDDDSFEEYEFADQTRVRAISFVPGGYRSLHGQSSKPRTHQDCEEDLIVDVDDTLTYGGPQYTELDVIHNVSSLRQAKELDQLQKAVLLDPTAKRHVVDSKKWSNDCEKDEISESIRLHDENAIESNVDVKGEDIEDKEKSKTEVTDHILSSLKEKIRDLEEQNKNVRCLICLELYTKPVVSTTCWHVHCEECWLMTMGVKKLCPQCNMIVFPSDLRRIYL